MEQQVLELVEGTLKPDSTIIRNSELGLHALYPNPQFPFALLAIATNTGIAVSSRRAALTTLKTYISGTWSPVFDDTFLGTVYLDSQAKSQIRDQVFNLAITQDAHRGNAEVYKIAASVTSRIAAADFPDEWPNLLSYVLGLLGSSENDSTIQSSLFVLADLIDAALTEDQFFGAARDLVNSLYHVAANSNLSLLNRAIALHVFQACFGTLEMVLAEHGNAVRAFLDESLKTWVAFLTGVLREPLPSFAEASSSPEKADLRRGLITLQVQATKTLDKMRHVYSAGLTPYSVDLFQVIWERLNAVLPEYTQFFVTGQEEGNLQGEEGLPFSLDALVMEEIDFFAALLKAPPVRNELDKQLHHGTFVQDLIRVLSQYSCVPDEGAEMWEADAEIYLTEMNLVSANYTARSACADLVTRSLYGWLKEGLFEAMLLSDPTKTSTLSWKEKEAFLFLLNQTLNEADMATATLSPGLVTRLMEQASAFLQDSSPYVRAGAQLVLGSLFVVAGDGFADAAASAFANAVTSASSDESDAVKVACFSAFADYIQALPAKAAAPLQYGAILAVAEFIHSHDIQEEFEDAEEIKSTLIIAVRDAMLIDTTKLEQTPAIDCFFVLASEGATSDNPTIFHLSAESFERIVESVALHGDDNFAHFSSRILPALTGAFNVADMTEESNLTNLAAELVAILAEHGSQPLPSGFVAAVMPKLQRVLMTATVDLLVQPATRAVQHLLSKGTSQFIEWKDSNGASSLEVVLTIINRLLNAPEVDENAAQEVGGLASAVVEKYGPEALGPYLVELLRALATRLGTAERIQFIQSLCMVFVSLSTTTAADVVTFLDELKINGQSGLQVVLTKWLENSVLFAGFEDVRKNIVALSKLFDLQDDRIKQIGVKGDLIVENTGRIKTRSQARLNPDRYTTIPADLKILKLLVDELVNAANASARFAHLGAGGAAAKAARASSTTGAEATGGGSDDGGDDDDDDDEWEDEPAAIDLSSKAVRDELMSFAEQQPGGGNSSDRPHDNEAVEYLAAWFRAKGAEPGFQNRFALLNVDEQQKLKNLLG